MSCNDNIVVSGCNEPIPEKISSDAVLINDDLPCVDTNQCDPLTLALQKTNELLCPSAIMNALAIANASNTTIHSILCNLINSSITTTTTTTTVTCSIYELFGGFSGTTVFTYIECGETQVTTLPISSGDYFNVCAENYYGVIILSGFGSYTKTDECFTTTTTTSAYPCSCITFSNRGLSLATVFWTSCTGGFESDTVPVGGTLNVCGKDPTCDDLLVSWTIGNPCYNVGVGVFDCTTTTTTTTIAPKQMVIQANAVVSIGQLEPWQITSTCPFSINWGDGTTTNYDSGVNISIIHVYANPYTGNIILSSYNLSAITSIIFDDVSPLHTTSPLYNPITILTSELFKLKGLQNLNFSSFNIFLSGIAAQLPRSLETLNVVNTNLSGSTYDLPQNSGGYIGLINTTLTGANTIGGPTLGLPRSLEYINIQGNNFISGTTTDLPRLLYNLQIEGNNTISGFTGDIFDTPTVGIPRSVETLIITGNNTINGDIAFLPHVLYQCMITGLNTVYGDIADLSLQLENIEITGANYISGDIQSLSLLTNLYKFYIQGANTLVGDTQYLPSLIETFYISGTGAFSITGDLTTNPLPSGIIVFIVSGSIGSASILGDLSDLETLPLIDFVIGNNNAFTGNLTSLSLIPTLEDFELSASIFSSIAGNLSSLSLLTSLDTFVLSCNNTVTGNISSITGLVNMNKFVIEGQNTITGNIGLLPANSHFIKIGGTTHTVNVYSIPIAWTSVMNTFSITGGTTPLGITTITNLINDLGLTGVTWGTVNNVAPSITLRGPAFTGPSTSYTNLITQGVTITYV
jgi:hypothetical protein